MDNKMNNIAMIKELIHRVFLPLSTGERLSGFSLGFLLLIVLFSCTEHTGLKLRSAHVNLEADWEASGLTAPGGIRFWFYPASGGSFTRDCPPEGFVGEVKSDSYRVLAVGSDFHGVMLTGMESYETATAAVQPVVSTRSDGLQAVSQADGLCLLPFDAFTVEGGGAMVHRATPRTLGSTIRLTFTVDRRDHLASLEGTFQGVYPSVLLSTGAPTEEARAAAVATVTPFSVSLTGDGFRCDVRTLGVLYPADGETYTNKLRLTTVSTDGQMLSTQTDLTEELSRVMEANGGLLPLSLTMSVSLDVEFEPEPVLKATTTVRGWNDGGSTEGDVWN